MTNEQKLKILRDREQRAFELLGRTEPTEPAFMACVSAIRSLGLMAYDLEDRSVEAAPNEEQGRPLPDDDQTPDPEATVDAEKAACGDPDATTQDELTCTPWGEPSAAIEAPAKAYTKDEVTAILTDLRNNHGVDIAGVMQELGFAKLSSVPADRYAELVAKAQAARETA